MLDQMLYRAGGYIITVIEDEEPVALAGTLPMQTAAPSMNGLIVSTLGVLAVLAVITLLVVYTVRCRQYQLRIEELSLTSGKEAQRHSRWSVSSLRFEVNRLEEEISSELLDALTA